MKRYKYIILILLLVLVISGQAWSEEAESFTINGLKVIFKQNTATDIIAANMYFRGGATVLLPEQAGIENFALIVAQKATKNFPKEKLNATLEKMDSRITSRVTQDYSSLNLLCVTQHFKNSWEVFVDMLLNPVFDSADVDLERQRILTAIKQSKDNPDAYLNDLVIEGFFVHHPYATDVNGIEQSISSFTGPDLKTYLTNRVEASQMLLVVVGNTTKTELENLVKESFSSLKTGEFKSIMPAPVSFQESSIKIVNRDLPTNYIQGTFPAPAYGNMENYSMDVARSILRDRLFEEVRTKRGLSYAPSAGVAGTFANYGWIYVTAVDADSTISVMKREVERIKNEPVSDNELKNKLNVFLTGYYLGNETNASQANLLARMELSGAGYAESAKMLENLKKVTPQSIREVCDKYMNNLQFVLLGNPPTLEIKRFMF